jgi:hypothetical protein
MARARNSRIARRTSVPTVDTKAFEMDEWERRRERVGARPLTRRLQQPAPVTAMLSRIVQRSSEDLGQAHASLQA